MIPIFTILFIGFILVLQFQIRKSDAQQDEVDQRFWERERQANTIRKKDISNLDYITIPEDLFPMNLATDTENSLAALRGKKMLNLTGKTNTDLKLLYGVSNLEELSEYDDNFTLFVRLVPDYANQLQNDGQIEQARRLLEFAVEKQADSKNIFTQLAQLYAAAGEGDKIQSLIAAASELESLSKLPIISSLQDIQNQM